MTQCSSCQQELQPEFESVDADYQFRNALWIGFHGGYGMFIESPDYAESVVHSSMKKTGASASAVLCHDCAHRLCDQNPWIAQLIKPEISHSHTQEFWDDNPDHEGWDSPSLDDEDEDSAMWEKREEYIKIIRKKYGSMKQDCPNCTDEKACCPTHRTHVKAPHPHRNCMLR